MEWAISFNVEMLRSQTCTIWVEVSAEDESQKRPFNTPSEARCQGAPKSGQLVALCMRPPKDRFSPNFSCSKCPRNNGIGHLSKKNW